MAQNSKAKTNGLVANEQIFNNSGILSSKILTEDEELEKFANLIIDIYFNQQHENEKNQRSSSN